MEAALKVLGQAGCIPKTWRTQRSWEWALITTPSLNEVRIAHVKAAAAQGPAARVKLLTSSRDT